MSLWATDLWNPDLWGADVWQIDPTGSGSSSLLLSKNKRTTKMANTPFTVIPPVTTSTTITTQTFANEWGVGAEFYINVSSIGTATLQVTLQGVDKLSGAVYTVLAGPTISGNGLTRLQIFPGAATTANVSVNDLMPLSWRLVSTVGGTGNITYSVSAVLFG